MKSPNYLYSFILLGAASFLYNRYKKQTEDDEGMKQYELVKKYLLNDSSLAKSKKPIIWIHMTYEVNARWWPSFNSRNSDCLNQPYIYLTLKSIIDKCGNNFNICMIDDDTFANILPGWAVDLNLVANPIKSKLRELALAKVLYNYGGVVVPNSFICFQNLIDTYNTYTSNNKMFVGELLDRNSTSQQVNFFPNTKFMGCEKENSTMKDYIAYLETMNSTDYTDESNFLGAYGRWCNEKIVNGEMNLLTADKLGMKDTLGKPVTIERLMGNTYIDLPGTVKGLYIPADEILKRSAFQWFARLSAKQALASDTIISKYLVISN
uniref:Nucleotide-diphospho-sugar transferase domain-containing protein n=1 Tax=viral metagenome TaxID=1070528 RepID=A0A6C0HXI5_9ZZZZ